jgi:recombination protein RecA
LGVEKGIILKQGSWFSYNGDKLGQGRETVRQLLADNEELKKEIVEKIESVHA